MLMTSSAHAGSYNNGLGNFNQCLPWNFGLHNQAENDYDGIPEHKKL